MSNACKWTLACSSVIKYKCFAVLWNLNTSSVFIKTLVHYKNTLFGKS